MKTSVVTGGASGIGLELSKLLIEDNYKVFIIDNNSKNSNVIESKKFVKSLKYLERLDYFLHPIKRFPRQNEKIIKKN